MKLTYYDILSHLIPGTSLIVFFRIFFYRCIPQDILNLQYDILFNIATIFGIGFLISSLSNFLELCIDKITSINPEEFMFCPYCARRYRFYEHVEIRKYLKSLDNKENYALLKRIAYQSTVRNKLNLYKAQTSFARNFSVVLLICLIFSLSTTFDSSNFAVSSLLAIFLLLSIYRYFRRRIEYIVEIFNTVINNTTINKEILE